ncbi:Monooxygenase FAD-binding protein [Penicillium atrosanguineum]|nr:Monooxygenase FAD-binding protein [Penicillium atrosanguineum]
MEVFKGSIAAEGHMPAMFKYNEGNFIAIIAAGDEGNRNLVMYPFRMHWYMSVSCTVPDTILKDLTSLEYSWNAKGNVEELAENIRGFPRWLRRLSSYVKGRGVLIGDAAHSMVPYQGQGANQCLEDVEGLNALFADVSDGDFIPDRLRLWDRIRRPRASGNSEKRACFAVQNIDQRSDTSDLGGEALREDEGGTCATISASNRG